MAINIPVLLIANQENYRDLDCTQQSSQWSFYLCLYKVIYEF